ncbi:MAG: MotA/TolQ/ExbB proton channel family protein, partial [Treponema sp.]|nr:MotA/TolQ/ExbB proton channel family protein [Treponema sp.]
MEGGTVSFSLLEMFNLGGVFMWPLLAFSIATVTLGIERLIYLLYHNLKIGDLGRKVAEFLAANDYQGAKDYLSALTQRRMGARILLALVNRASPAPGKVFAEHHVERATETEAMICINSLEKGF